MARTTLAPASAIVVGGLLMAGAAPNAVDGNLMQNNGRQFLWVKNGDSAPHTLTFTPYPLGNAPEGLTVSPLVVTVTAGTEQLIGPFPPSVFNDAAGGVEFIASSATSMLVAAFSFQNNPA